MEGCTLFFSTWLLTLVYGCDFSLKAKKRKSQLFNQCILQACKEFRTVRNNTFDLVNINLTSGFVHLSAFVYQMGAELGALAISHLEEVTDEGIAAMANTKTAAVLLPTTAYILR